MARRVEELNSRVACGVLFAWSIWNVKQRRTATVKSQVSNAYYRKLYNAYINHYHRNTPSHHNLLEKTPLGHNCNYDNNNCTGLSWVSPLYTVAQSKGVFV